MRWSASELGVWSCPSPGSRYQERTGCRSEDEVTSGGDLGTKTVWAKWGQWGWLMPACWIFHRIWGRSIKWWQYSSDVLTWGEGEHHPEHIDLVLRWSHTCCICCLFERRTDPRWEFTIEERYCSLSNCADPTCDIWRNACWGCLPTHSAFPEGKLLTGWFNSWYTNSIGWPLLCTGTALTPLLVYVKDSYHIVWPLWRHSRTW